MMTRYLSFDGNYIPPQHNWPDNNWPDWPDQKYPAQTKAPTIIYATPTPLVQYITPAPTATPTPIPQHTGTYEPKAGDTIMLTAAQMGTITVYDETMTQVRGTYPHGTQAMLLRYGTSSCMIYVGGGVAYVPTWNVYY